MKNLKIYFLLVLSMLLWGFSFVWAKIALETYSPFTIVLFRLFIAVSFIYLFSLVAKIKIKIHSKDLPWFLLLAFFEPFLYFLGELFGLQKVSATTASVIISTIPIFVPIFSFFIFKEKLLLINIFGGAFSFVGVLIIVFNKHLQLEASTEGILLMFLAVFAATGYSLVVKKISEKYNAMSIVFFQNVFAIIGFLPLFIIFDLKEFVNINHNINSIISIVELGIFASSIAFILFAQGIKEIGVSKAGFFSNIIPVFTAVVAFFVLDERLSIFKYLGIFIVILGLFLSQMNSLNLKKKGNKI